MLGGKCMHICNTMLEGLLAGKITARCFLEGLNNTELVGLIETYKPVLSSPCRSDEPTSLQGRIHEALATLEAHNLKPILKSLYRPKTKALQRRTMTGPSPRSCPSG